ncbi:MAG: DEAD/DEAH box helicase [Bacteroidetes bacterium]|nr:DEAD/DEAH box helicase [Bacteroidota bacterium]
MNFIDLNLSSTLINALNDLGFTSPTAIQEQAFPVIMSGRDAVGIAQTGTGKTFAYLLPLLRQLKFSDQKHPRVLIIVPTRELVKQVLGEIEKLTRYMNIRYAGVYGGTNINTQKKVVYNGLDVLVATPGRLIDLAFTGVLRLNGIQKLVLDEVDELLAQGFRAQTIQILELLPEKRQSLMFSATLTEDVQELIAKYFIDPLWVEAGSKSTPIELISHFVYHVSNFRTKVNLLASLLRRDAKMSKVLVFVADKKSADRLFEMIETQFPGEIAVIHSNKSQNYRFGAITKFEEGTHRVLVATDLASKGLDIDGITHVVNFNIPEIAEDYIHRTGRTGRAEKQGIAISFAGSGETELIQSVIDFTKIDIQELPLPEDMIISEELFADEIPDPLFDKDYLKMPLAKPSVGAFHEKKEKKQKRNMNLGGPKKRNPKHGKPANRSAVKKKKTRF